MIRGTITMLLAATLLAGCASTGNSTRGTVDNAAAAESNVKLGVAYMEQGRMELAKEKLDRAGKQDPKNADAQFALGELYNRLKMPREADRHFRNAISLAPDKLEIVNGYAVFLCTNGEVDRGIEQFDKLIRNPLYGRQQVAATNAGMCLRDQKRHAEAVRYFETAIAKQPDFIQAVVQLADTHLTLERPDAARKAVDDYQSMRNSAAVLILGVRAAVLQGNCGAAQAYARKLRTDFTNSRENLQLLPQVLGSCTTAATP